MVNPAGHCQDAGSGRGAGPGGSVADYPCATGGRAAPASDTCRPPIPAGSSNQLSVGLLSKKYV